MNLNTRFIKLVLIAVLIVILVIPVGYTLLTASITINCSGTVASSNVTALSGSAPDIQAAVNTVAAAGGGTVHIPAGNFAFNPPANGIGVIIPYTNVPISIIGAGIGQTVLTETQFSGFSTMFARTWSGQSYSAASVRISGISFVGFVYAKDLPTGITDDWNTQGNNGISIACTQDFRIDHCSFQNFCSAAIGTNANTGSIDYTTIIDRGVIDHCTFSNPYKTLCQPFNATGVYSAIGGYDIIVVGDYYAWDSNIQDYLGHYYQFATLNSTNDGNPTQLEYGAPVPQTIYIENNNFTEYRHAISSTGGGYYVVRYNYFSMPAQYRAVDIHGNPGGSTEVGGRGLEAYGNTIDLTNESMTNGDCAAFGLRGGSGVIWNNTIIIPNGGNVAEGLALGIEFNNDADRSFCLVNHLYYWNNAIEEQSGTQITEAQSISTANYNPGLNVGYFLRAPDTTDDGFTYTPYTYPLPLTLEP
ncbi:MAG: hypothetical protein ABSF44_14940 [Candidatus Bathyarchaeia archaeon]|jgi:hypothetical protein